MSNQSIHTHKFYLRRFIVVPTNDQIIWNDNPHKIEPKAMSVLIYLVQNSERIVSLQELMDNVWAGSIVTPQTVQRCIFILRKIFKQDPDNAYIQTFTKKGYQCVVDPKLVELNQNFKLPVHAKKPWLWAAAAAVILVMVSVSIWLSPQQPQPPKLYSDEPYVLDFSWHPNGEHLAYVSTIAETGENYLRIQDSQGEVYDIAMLSAKPLVVADLAWSPSGKQLIVHWLAEEANFDLFRVDIKALEQATRQHQWQDLEHRYRNIAFIDEKSLLFTRTSKDSYAFHLEQYDLISQVTTPVFEDDSKRVEEFAIKHDRLAYVVEDEWQFHVHLRLFSQGTELANFTVSEMVKDVSWLPDLSGVVFKTESSLYEYKLDAGLANWNVPLPPNVDKMEVRDSGDVYYLTSNMVDAVYVREFNACCATELNPSDANQFYGKFSPDGNQVALVSEQSGLPQLWLVADGKGRQLTQFNSRKSISAIHWSHDNQWLVYKVDNTIYAHSLIVDSSTMVVENQLHSEPLGFASDSNTFFYKDVNGFRLKLRSQDLRSSKSSVAELPAGSDVIMAAGRVFFKARGSHELYEQVGDEAVLIADDFERDATLLSANDQSLFYFLFRRSHMKRVLGFDLATGEHRIAVERNSYLGNVEDINLRGDVMISRSKLLRRQINKLEMDTLAYTPM